MRFLSKDQEIIIDALDSERESLRVFKLDRSTAIVNLLTLFEISVADLFDYDNWFTFTYPHKLLTPMTGRNKLEDAICNLVMSAWKLSSSENYPEISRGTLEIAVEAFDYQVKRQHIEDALWYSRFGLNKLSRANDGAYRFEDVESLRNKQIRASLMELTLEPYSQEKELNLLRSDPSERKRPPIERWTKFQLGRAYNHGFSAGMDVGGYTIAQYVAFWSAVHDQAFQRFYRYHKMMVGGPTGKIDPILLVQIIRREDLVNDLSILSNLEEDLVSKIVDDLTFVGSNYEDGLYLRPFVPISRNYLAVTPSILVNNGIYRNLRQRLAYENKPLYLSLTKELANNMVENIIELLISRGFQARKNMPVTDEAGKKLTDIDVLAYQGGKLLVLQVKNLIPPDSLKQMENSNREIVEGLRQLRHSVAFVNEIQHLRELVGLFDKSRSLTEIEIRDYLITGLDRVRGVSISALDANEKIQDLVRFPDLLDSIVHGKNRPESSPMMRRTKLQAKVGSIVVEIESISPEQHEGAIADLDHLLPLSDLLDYLQI